MSGAVHVLGVRHHGPGSARTIVRALEHVKPDCIVVEGPPDAHEVLALAGHAEMKPPVAILVYEPDTPSNAVYFPFAEFSPEWQAIRWGLKSKAEVRFIDLPIALRDRFDEKTEEEDAGGKETEDKEQESVGSQASGPQDSGPQDQVSRSDPLDALAKAAGFEDGEAWWGRLIEERRGDEHPLEVFDAIREAMTEARAQLGHSRDDDEPAREAHMRKCIRAAVKEGYEKIVVVCGAWHAPVLTSESLKSIAPKADDEILKPLKKRKIAATWIPWTHGRLTMESGYGAGVASPGWYEHLWIHHSHTAERWLARVARLMRDEDLDASPAHVVEGVRLAESLAALRGRAIAGLEELGEATLSIICAGNPLPMRLIERKLIVGERLGDVPADAPTVPLQRDLAALQKSLRMKMTADEQLLDLDQRKEMDLNRSQLLHRLTILSIPWGVLQEDARRTSSTFHEIWQLQWMPEFAVKVVEAAQFGNTVEEAASNWVLAHAAKATDLPPLTAMLDDVLLADLPKAVEKLIERIQNVSAVASDVGHLMEALPPLASVMRYGNVRKTDLSMLEPIVSGLVARICAGLGPACGSLDDDAAEKMLERINGVHSSLTTLDRAELTEQWHARLLTLGDADVHPLVPGRCWRILLDAHAAAPEAVEARFSLALSPGNDPGKSSAWLEGFLSGSGTILVHDPRLLALVDAWVASLPTAIFEQICPIVRRTFSTFEKPERRMIGEKVKKTTGGSPASAAAPVATDDYDPVRGDLMLPVLKLILGEVPQ